MKFQNGGNQLYSALQAGRKVKMPLSQYGIIATNTGNGTKSPQTGDNSNMFLWVALLFASGGVLTVLGVTDKRKEKGITK